MFQVKKLIRFAHCDPAAIVYYPNYFDMFNSVVEDWFNHGLEIGYDKFIIERRCGLPTVTIQCDFLLPCRMGDTLTLALSVEKTGRSSITLSIRGLVEGEQRLRARLVLVTTSLETHRPIPIPGDLLSKLEEYRKPASNHEKQGES